MKKQADPFKKDEKKKMLITNKLQYAKGGTFRCRTRYPRREESNGEKEHEDLKGIAKFISTIQWQTEWNEEGGIT